MSVRGEFLRIVGDAIAVLRGIGSAPAEALAADLEQARAGAEDDLSSAASRVLELWSARAPAAAEDAVVRDRLEDAGERVLAASRIILGR